MPTVYPGYILYDAVEAPVDNNWLIYTQNYSSALDASHSQYNLKYGGAWGGWGSTPTTPRQLVPGEQLKCQLVLPLGVSSVAFRRTTPTYPVINSPLLVGTRVSAKNLRAWANQGLFAAQEWAGIYSVPVEASPTVGTSLYRLPLPYAQCSYRVQGNHRLLTDWPFSFPGGYLQPSHVQLLCRIGGILIQIPVNTQAAPGAAVYLQGSGYLHIDIPRLESDFLGVLDLLVIYRNTLRSGEASVPDTSVGITAQNMEASSSVATLAIQEIADLVYPAIDPNLPPDLLPVIP
jgi:hypothetical protein